MFLAGLIIAAVVAVPILNLTAPIFATVFMTQLHKALSPARRMSAGPPPART